EKGDKADFFYVLVSGKVALFEPSNQSFIANLEPGSSFGEQAILVGGVRSLSARAAEPTVCKAISAQTLGKMLDQEQGTIKPVVYALLLELYMSNDLKSQGLK
ncbi:MAG: cyclic nucleotide-binding domain-containing protein, partial [Burkholderiaceae bacterium]